MTETAAGAERHLPVIPDELVARARTERWAERLFERDASLWSTDPEVQGSISERLGWLSLPDHFQGEIGPLEAFGEAVRDAGFTTAIVAGMGGSSLAPEVLAKTFGDGGDWLRLRILDSTDPAAVTAIADASYPLETLFIVASKSGTTAEPLAFLADAWERIEKAIQERHLHQLTPGDFVTTVTDPGHSLEAIPHHDLFREVFLNPPDVGGRYSALTYVGLLPGSLIGLDLDPFIASARAMLDRCRTKDPLANPGLALGLALGASATLGRNKLTFVADPELVGFGSWAEQLIAESTGKQEVGIVPVDLEPLGAADVYGSDRIFVRLTMAESDGPAFAPDGSSADALLGTLEAAGHPVIRIHLDDPIDIAAEFVRWEVATAIAGIVLGIDPFDQPNVEEAKEHTREALAGLDRGGTLPTPPAGSTVGTTDDALLEAALRLHLARLAPNGYACLQAYIAPTAGRDAALARIRVLLRDATTRATTSGYGPRFLHSTGQLHKGGPPNGWFLQLTADHPVDRPIPGKPYTFGQLIDAQALGDLGVLQAHDLAVLRVHLGPDPDTGLTVLERVLAAALREA